jgi:hypothetical protein
MIKRHIFVTNSSSSHNVVYDPKGELRTGHYWTDGGFGWEHFVLFRPEDKAVYMAVVLLEHLESGQRLEEEEAINKVNALLGMDILKVGGSYYIDHQSRITLPRREKDPEGWVCMPFFKELFDYIVLSPTVVILGGNDNQDAPEWMTGFEDNHKWNILRMASKCLCERDGDGWILRYNNWLYKSETTERVKFYKEDSAAVELDKLKKKFASKLPTVEEIPHKKTTGKPMRRGKRRIGQCS